jgi:hypothetical protein
MMPVKQGDEPSIKKLSDPLILLWFFPYLKEKQGFKENMVKNEQEVAFNFNPRVNQTKRLRTRRRNTGNAKPVQRIRFRNPAMPCLIISNLNICSGLMK